MDEKLMVSIPSFVYVSVLNYSVTDPNVSILPLLKRIIKHQIPVWIFSGDQDSVVPFLGSRTLVRELAHDLKFGVTAPYGAWFYKGQVNYYFRFTSSGYALHASITMAARYMYPISIHFTLFAPIPFWTKTDALQVGGWATEYGNLLTFATVRGAAHMVPYAQPARALRLFRSFVNGQRLPNATYPPIDDDDLQ